MASIDGGTLAAQRGLKCQINSVRAPDTQEFLYLAPWEADKDFVSVSRPLLNTGVFLFFFPYASSHNSGLLFLLLLLSFKQQSGSVSVCVTPAPSASLYVKAHTPKIDVKCLNIFLIYTLSFMFYSRELQLRNSLSLCSVFAGCIVIWYTCGEPQHKKNVHTIVGHSSAGFILLTSLTEISHFPVFFVNLLSHYLIEWTPFSNPKCL